MKPPEGWTLFNEYYWRKQVRVRDDRWLTFFFNYSDDKTLPGFACVTRSSGTDYVNYIIKESTIKHPCSLLEVECIAHEWAKDILEGRI